MERERVASARLPWGKARVAFRANIPAIQPLLDERWPLTTVYQHVQDSLAGVSYRQFIYHVRKEFPSASQLRGVNNKEDTQSTASAEKASTIEPKQAPKPVAEKATNGPKLDMTPPPKPAPFEFIKSYRPGPKAPNLKDLF